MATRKDLATLLGHLEPFNHIAEAIIFDENESVKDILVTFQDLLETTRISNPLGIRPFLPGYLAENKQGSMISAGSPVSVHGSGVGVMLASASPGGRSVSGFALEDTLNGFAVSVLTSGIFFLSDWTYFTGSMLLPTSTPFFLSSIAGKISALPPSIVGYRIQQVGQSVSPNELEINISRPILL